MAVAWAEIAPFVQEAFDRVGRVERADVVDLAYDQNANDDVVDALDMIGSRVFPTVEATRDFLVGQKAVSE
ncbi:MAG TPA: hypothetical protein VKV26_20510 [Dehalococcoidia bacterium]|nr:hypothetical protein [Dehalococcoidia bacterium]